MLKIMYMLDAIFSKEEDPVVDDMEKIFLLLVGLFVIMGALLSSLN